MNMKKYFYIVVSILMALSLCACSSDEYEAKVTELRLVSVNPANGYPGDIVTILGRNFSPDSEKDSVSINGVSAQIIEAYKDKLLIILPENVPGEYTVKVTSPAGTLEGLKINYLKIPDHEYLVTTVIGQQNVRKCVDGIGTSALTYLPTGVNKAPDGSIWFTDRGGNCVRRIAQDMTVTTLADLSAGHGAVWQGCFDAQGNYYFCDKGTGEFEKYTVADGKVTVIASGMSSPMNVCMDKSGNFYVSVRDDKVIYKFDSKMNKTVFADIPERPNYCKFDPKGNLIVTLNKGYKIESIAPDGTISNICGDGVKPDAASDGLDGDPLTASINVVRGIDFDSNGIMYFSDATFNRIRKLTPDANGDYSKGKLETIAGDSQGYADGKGLNVKFYEPDDILVYDDNTIYIADANNCLIRKMTIK
jgi:sugar lactone lactonase YvrE